MFLSVHWIFLQLQPLQSIISKYQMYLNNVLVNLFGGNEKKKDVNAENIDI